MGHEELEPTLDDLADPRFLEWLASRIGGKPIQPDRQDHDLNAHAVTDEEGANQYRLARARKLLRLWKEWKAEAN
jgi:hypothetical protein